MKKAIITLQIIAILSGILFIIFAMLFMDKSNNDSDNSALMISGSILLAAGLLSLKQ